MKRYRTWKYSYGKQSIIVKTIYNRSSIECDPISELIVYPKRLRGIDVWDNDEFYKLMSQIFGAKALDDKENMLEDLIGKWK